MHPLILLQSLTTNQISYRCQQGHKVSLAILELYEGKRVAHLPSSHLDIILCNQEYYTTAILGCETDTYDSEGAMVRQAPFTHVTPEKISAALGEFRGSIKQLPPMFAPLVISHLRWFSDYLVPQLLSPQNGR